MSADRSRRRFTEKPRPVTRGLRLTARPERLGATRAAATWVALIQAAADDEAELAEGLRYAKIGQVIRLDVSPGLIEAQIQGRPARPYRWSVEFDRFRADEWDRFVEAVAAEARLAHGIGEGGIPGEVLDLAATMGLPLVPASQSDRFTAHCTCADAQRGPQEDSANPRWCKHAIAAAYLLAERLDDDPSLAWNFRAVDPVELGERIRLQRALDSGAGAATAHQPVDRATISVTLHEPVEATDSYYDVGLQLHDFETHLAAPDVGHLLLRRLGPSPFPEARFPILGLLATCYEIVSDTVMREQTDE